MWVQDPQKDETRRKGKVIKEWETGRILEVNS